MSTTPKSAARQAARQYERILTIAWAKYQRAIEAAGRGSDIDAARNEYHGMVETARAEYERMLGIAEGQSHDG